MTTRTFALLNGTFLMLLACGGLLLPWRLQAAPAAPPTLADYKAIYEKELSGIRTNNAAVLDADKAYREALETLRDRFKKQGDFDGTTGVMAEQKRFAATKMVPDRAPADLPPAIDKAQARYRATLMQIEADRTLQTEKLTTSYVNALKGLIKTLLAQDKMTEAEAVNAEMKRAQAGLPAVPTGAKDPADTVARSAVGQVSATGGSVTNYTLNGVAYRAHIFTDSGTFQITAGGKVDVLVVAGGGGGGGASRTYSSGGGGGAGGMLSVADLSVSIGSIAVTVGDGGSGGVAGANVGDPGGNGGKGDNSLFGSTTAIGGGGGAGYTTQAGSGGSGGGGDGWDGAAKAAGKGTIGQGHKGGKAYVAGVWYGSGGGGGAAMPGVDGTSKSNGGGGNGALSAIAGSSVTYAGGGGGGGHSNNLTAGAPGGTGGGGNGGNNSGVGSSGTANTGGGGGGGGSGKSGGSGGSGIVIVRYRLQ